MNIIRIFIYSSIFIGLFTLAMYLLSFIGRRRPRALKREKIFEPFFSIIIPAYNEESALEETVKSAININYPKDKFEILIIDDGSKDDTLKIARRLEKKYDNIRVFTKKNGGKGSALNFGIKKAKGEYVASFDSDSMVIPDAPRYQLPYFENPKVMCVTPALKVYKPKSLLQRVQAIEYDLGIFLRRVFANLDAIHVTPGPFSIYRKKFFLRYGGYDEHNMTEDMEIALRIQSNNYIIENSPKALVYTIAPSKFRDVFIQRRRWYFGFIKNFWNYKHLFGKKYGEMGVIITPLAVISVLMTMAMTLYYIGDYIVNTVKELINYSYIGYDFLGNSKWVSYMVSLRFFNMISENFVLFGIMFFCISITTLLLINSRVKSVDRPISTFINYAVFIFLYSILFTFWWAVSIVYSLTHKEVKW